MHFVAIFWVADDDVVDETFNIIFPFFLIMTMIWLKEKAHFTHFSLGSNLFVLLPHVLAHLQQYKALNAVVAAQLLASLDLYVASTTQFWNRPTDYPDFDVLAPLSQATTSISKV